jgi:hypothetical protein
MALLAEINRDSKRRPEPFAPADFLPSWAREPKGSADGEAKPEKAGGMDPEYIRGVMERLQKHQELVEKQRGRLGNGGGGDGR